MSERDPQCIWKVGALLGEGPAWFPNEGVLRFVDIKGGKLHTFTPNISGHETAVLGGQPSFVLPARDGRLVVGSGNRVIATGPRGENPVTIAQVPVSARNRINDASVDHLGRLWFGTMDDEERSPTGSLWCFDRGKLHAMGGEAIVTNGPAISRDASELFHVDSVARTIWRYTIGEGPTIRRREVFLQLSDTDGHPDGIALDSEDCLWVALWDGASVRRYSPTGELLTAVNFPCARVTKLAFGGPDLGTAFVTTACIGLSKDQLSDQPLAGGLFSFAAQAPGRTLPEVNLG